MSARAPESVVQAGQVVFEPDDVTFADNRVIVTGRWFGVRGRRFVRPTLTFGRDGSGSRLLAELEHKPWTAADGEPWTAAFASQPIAGGADQLELAVAPDIAVSLTAPDALRARPTRVKRTSARRHQNTASRPRDSDQQAEITRLRDLLSRTEVARAEWTALSKRKAAVAKLDTVIRERDAAVAEREAVVDKLRRLARERDALEHERDALKRRRRELERAHAEVERERDQLRTELEAAVAARESEPVSRPNPIPAVASEPTAVAVLVALLLILQSV